MTKQEFDEMAALVVRLRKELEHTTQHLVAHIDALTKSNAQCGEYLRQNEKLRADVEELHFRSGVMCRAANDSHKALHSELVEVRAALALVTEQRDSLQRTLDEWSNADTTPHERVAADDVADHVVPPVLPLCMTCHECGGVLRPSRAAGSHSVLCCRTERCSRINTAWQDDVSPYSGACNSSTPVRHE